MIMDFLNRTYVGTVNIAPGVTATIRWYRAPEGARVLPTSHAFASSVWESDARPYPSDSIGEVDRAFKVWSDGSRPPWDWRTGRETATPLEWFRTGVPADQVGVDHSTLACNPLWTWLRPEGIVSAGELEPISEWRAQGVADQHWIPGILPPPYRVTDPETGLPVAVFSRLTTGGLPPALARSVLTHLPGPEVTTYLVTRSTHTMLLGFGGTLSSYFANAVDQLPRISPGLNVSVRLGGSGGTAFLGAQPAGWTCWSEIGRAHV